MNKAELLEAIEDYPPHAKILLASDSEGNSYRELCSTDFCSAYTPHREWEWELMWKEKEDVVYEDVIVLW